MDVGPALSVASAAVALATLGVKEIASRRRRRTLAAQIKENDENPKLDRGAKASAVWPAPVAISNCRQVGLVSISSVSRASEGPSACTAQAA